MGLPGDVAQLGERLHGMQEVGGSSPPVSTRGEIAGISRDSGGLGGEKLLRLDLTSSKTAIPLRESFREARILRQERSISPSKGSRWGFCERSGCKVAVDRTFGNPGAQTVARVQPYQCQVASMVWKWDTHAS